MSKNLESDARDELLAKEQFLLAEADKAYFKAGETSDPQHWLEAALMARQHRNALARLRAAPVPQCEAEPVNDGAKGWCPACKGTGRAGPILPSEAGRKTLGGMIATIYGELDPEDCAMVDREWARMRGYILPKDGTAALSPDPGTVAVASTHQLSPDWKQDQAETSRLP